MLIHTFADFSTFPVEALIFPKTFYGSVGFCGSAFSFSKVLPSKHSSVQSQQSKH